MNKMSAQILIDQVEDKIKSRMLDYEKIAIHNQAKVLAAMQKYRLSERHFYETTGYGYNDEGREVCEQIYAEIFGGEDALVRPQIVSGTHAIALCLFGVLRPGDELLSVTGKPYDTIQTVIGLNRSVIGQGTLCDYQISYAETELNYHEIEYNNIFQKINHKTKMIYIQRSTGYTQRSAVTIAVIKDIVAQVKSKYPDIIIFVDNCYGEFLEYDEPTNVGVDLIAGSLIKNPGGGLASSGGYIVGRHDLIEMISSRLTTPGLGKEVGANLGMIRHYLQGLFMAPHITFNALKGAILTAGVFSELGFQVRPGIEEERSDIIQSIVLRKKELVLQYCKAIQAMSPVDSYVEPQPWDMPGYEDEVIMAAGNFVQGSSIELSADAPIREPYVVYQQGGLTYEHVKLALTHVLCEIGI